MASAGPASLYPVVKPGDTIYLRPKSRLFVLKPSAASFALSLSRSFSHSLSLSLSLSLELFFGFLSCFQFSLPPCCFCVARAYNGRFLGAGASVRPVVRKETLKQAPQVHVVQV